MLKVFRNPIGGSEWFYIVGVLLLAAFLRFVGMDYGAPNMALSPSDAPYKQLPLETPIHPDEYFFVAIPFEMAVTKYPNPKFFENPNFLINLNFVTYMLTGQDGITKEMRAGIGQRQYAPFPMYVIGRVYSALAGVFAVAVVYATARRLGGRYAAAVASLFMAVCLTLVQHGHYATQSGFASAFTAVCVWACVVSLQGQRLVAWRFLLAGAAAGFAATSRYNAAGVSLMVFFTGLWLLYRFRTRDTVKIVFAGWLLFPAMFLFGTPGIIFDFPKFTRDFHGFSINFWSMATVFHKSI